MTESPRDGEQLIGPLSSFYLRDPTGLCQYTELP